MWVSQLRLHVLFTVCQQETVRCIANLFNLCGRAVLWLHDGGMSVVTVQGLKISRKRWPSVIQLLWILVPSWTGLEMHLLRWRWAATHIQQTTWPAVGATCLLILFVQPAMLSFPNRCLGKNFWKVRSHPGSHRPVYLKQIWETSIVEQMIWMIIGACVWNESIVNVKWIIGPCNLLFIIDSL